MLEAITVLSQVFNYVYVLTSGGPGNASSVMEFYIWKNGFALGSIGVASTVAVMLLALASGPDRLLHAPAGAARRSA